MEHMKEYLITALKIAQEGAFIGGEICRHYFGQDIKIEIKADNSPVSNADTETENAIRKHIESHYPDHQIIGEEGGNYPVSDSPWKWVIDPIDGTISFIHNVPLYTVLIALLYQDEPQLGVIYNPQTEEMVSAGTGLGCQYNNKPCQVSQIHQLRNARLLFSDATSLLHFHPQRVQHLIRSVKFSRTWADGYGYLMIATGRADIMIDPYMKLWDIACLMPIIRESGGCFTDMQGNSKLGSSSIATNGLLHAQVMEQLGISYI